MPPIKDNKQAGNKNAKEIPEPGPPSRPTIPHRLIGKLLYVQISIKRKLKNKNVKYNFLF